MAGASQSQPSALHGVLLIVAAVGIFAVMDTIAKYLARSYPVSGVVWARFAANLLILLVFLAARGELKRLRTARPGLQIMRGLLLAGASLLYFTSLTVLPLAEAAAIGFVMPLFLALLAVPMLGERMDGAVLLAFALPFAWVTPTDPWHWVLLGIIGLLASVGHFTLIRAYDYGSATGLAPFFYTQLVWVMLLGWLVFGDFPDGWSLLGMGIIVASGIYLVGRHRLTTHRA